MIFVYDRVGVVLRSPRCQQQKIPMVISSSYYEYDTTWYNVFLGTYTIGSGLQRAILLFLRVSSLFLSHYQITSMGI